MPTLAPISLQKSINRLVLVRTAWLVFALLTIGMQLAILPAYFELSQTVCPAEANCPEPRISSVKALVLQESGISVTAYAIYQTLLSGTVILTYWLASVLVFWSKSGNRFALLMAFFLLGFGVGFLTTPELVYGLHPALGWFYDGFSFFFLPFLFLFFYLFPDGRFVPPWTIFLLPFALFFGLVNSFWPEVQQAYLWLIPLILIMGGLDAQIHRYKRVSNPEQRQQTKWVVYGAGVAFLSLVVWITPFSLLSGDDLVAYELITLLPMALAFMLIPVSITIATLRYHLWDVDLIIRRTLVYTALTAALALVYFGLVILLEGMLRSLVGESGQVATVISTLAIAAMFAPLRRRVQEVIDRRFYRRKYNAEQALAEFAATTRAGTDLEALTAQMVGIARKTMQPEQVSLWLKEK